MSIVRIPLRKGTLNGYHVKNSTKTRQHALFSLTKKGRTPLEIFRKISALSILTKRTLPLYSNIYKSNRNWVKLKLFNTK